MGALRIISSAKQTKKSVILLSPSDIFADRFYYSPCQMNNQQREPYRDAYSKKTFRNFRSGGQDVVLFPSVVDCRRDCDCVNYYDKQVDCDSDNYLDKPGQEINKHTHRDIYSNSDAVPQSKHSRPYEQVPRHFLAPNQWTVEEEPAKSLQEKDKCNQRDKHSNKKFIKIFQQRQFFSPHINSFYRFVKAISTGLHIRQNPVWLIRTFSGFAGYPDKFLCPSGLQIR